MLYYNEEISSLLNNNISIIRSLQLKGIKIQISYLGNHENVGWSCQMLPATTAILANNMVDDVVKYGLDGINIDDEYSTCSGNTQAFYYVVNAIKNNPSFNNKSLTKALWNDYKYFIGPTSVSPLLDQGYEMSYHGDVNNLQAYIGLGMSKSKLLLGVSAEFNTQYDVNNITNSVISNGYNGIMIWAPNALLPIISKASQYYTEIAKAEYGLNEQVIYQQ